MDVIGISLLLFTPSLIDTKHIYILNHKSHPRVYVKCNNHNIYFLNIYVVKSLPCAAPDWKMRLPNLE